MKILIAAAIVAALVSLICVPVVLASLHIFTAGLQLQYRNWDAAVHFSWAMYSAARLCPSVCMPSATTTME